jgi:Uncharacterized conserved protein
MRTIGTKVFGLRTPIIRKGDDLVNIILDVLDNTQKYEGVTLKDHDIVGITEAILARAQGNYASVDQIALDVRKHFPSGTVGVVFPILSRNRFAMLLKGIARGAEKIVVQLSYPADEVGNALIAQELVEDAGLNPYSDILSEEKFRSLFGQSVRHRFTGVDYIEYYKSLGDNIEIFLANDPRAILEKTKNVIVADIHSRRRTQKRLLSSGAEKVLALDEILTAPVDGSGYNELYGLLGSNKASEELVKLFPRACDDFVTRLGKAIIERTGKNLEVLVYGDGGFRDPVGGIWELADPVISPAFTPGLSGTPNELKLKYIADNDYGHLHAEAQRTAVMDAIRSKGKKDLVGQMQAEGTTPRQMTDLLGSLCDLTSGSGDKGTPVVLVQGYFDDYSDA